MKKRIYNSMIFLVIFTVLLTSSLITGIIYRGFYYRIQEEIRNEALFISIGLNQNGEAFFSELENKGVTNRVTWIDADGRVLFDNVAEAKDMDNHLDRPEITEALKNGFGESVHLSKTMGSQTYYYAVRLNNGTVLRVSTTTDSIYKLVLNFIPYIFIICLTVLFMSLLIANLLTKKIITPINNLNLEKPLSNDIYDELSPLLSRMEKQNEKIENQFNEIKMRQEELRAIMENVSDGIIVLNSKGRIISINNAAAFIFDVGLEECVNKHILVLSRSSVFQEAVEAAIKGNSYENTITKGSSIFNLLASPVKDDKPVKGIILFVLDVTEKANAEKIRREFSANVSHELKTPLTSILGYAELLKNDMVKVEDISSFASRIYNEARNLINLVEDIIKLSRLDEKDPHFLFEEVDLLRLTENVVERLSSIAQKKEIDILVNGVKARIRGVRQILEEMIYNLCDNAIKYCDEKSKVELTVSVSNDNVILTVSDNGPGIEKEHQSRIFERFYRVDKSHSRGSGGTGLGLAIVKNGAKFHNAKIELFSKRGEGTKISIIFNRE